MTPFRVTLGGVPTICVADARSVTELVAMVDAGIQPEYIFFPGHRERPTADLGPSCLGRWWPAPFTVNDHQFASAEHHMMWSKAKLFDDDRCAEAILHASGFTQAKALCREIENVDESTWVSHRWEIVVEGSIAKFTSDPRLLEYLLGTDERVLVAASPLDLVWGNGLAMDSPLIANPRHWRGANLLGFALMEARQRIRQRADVPDELLR